MSYFKKDLDMWVSSDEITVSNWEFDGHSAADIKCTIDEVVARAVAKGMVGEGYFDFSAEQDYYGNGYGVTIKYQFTRMENDKERDTREKTELMIKENAAKKRKATLAKKKLKGDPEYAEFERLKAKFEGN